MTDETIGNVPILILGNKIDRPEAISEEKMREMFGLYGQTTGKVSEGPFPFILFFDVSRKHKLLLCIYVANT